jgi:hypothetical protein
MKYMTEDDIPWSSVRQDKYKVGDMVQFDPEMLPILPDLRPEGEYRVIKVVFVGSRHMRGVGHTQHVTLDRMVDGGNNIDQVWSGKWFLPVRGESDR